LNFKGDTWAETNVVDGDKSDDDDDDDDNESDGVNGGCDMLISCSNSSY